MDFRKKPKPQVPPLKPLLLAALPPINPEPQDLNEIHRLLSAERDRERLVGWAIKEGVAGLVYKSLIKLNLLDSLNKAYRQRLSAYYYRTLHLNLLRLRALQSILPALASAKIPIVLLKGIALIQDLYADIGLRPMSDIDAWVLPSDFRAAAGILSQSGYRQEPLYPGTFRKGLITLDLKTHLLGAERIKRRTLLLAKPQEDLFQRSRRRSNAADPARFLNPHDQVLYLSLHAFKHNVDKLIWLIDIQGVTRDWSPLDWRNLVHRAKELGQEKVLACMSMLLWRLLGYHPPLSTVGRYGSCRPNLLEKKLLVRKIKKGALPEWAPLIFFRGRGRPKRQLAYIFETLFPRPEILRQGFREYSSLTACQLYGRRFFQLADRAIASLRKSPSGRS